MVAVKLPWTKNEPSADAAAAQSGPEQAGTAPETTLPKGYTAPKGRATPKRNDVERAAGTRKQAFIAPETPKEARQRRRQLKESMSKEEYKAYKEKRRHELARQRQLERDRMLSGDERYLPLRDQGADRRLIRDWVDARRQVTNLFMPGMIVLLVLMFVGAQSKNYMFSNALSLAGMVFFLILIIDGIIAGRRVAKLVRSRYPDTALSGFSMGFYAFSRSCMIRRFRAPLPQKEIGDAV